MNNIRSNRFENINLNKEYLYMKTVLGLAPFALAALWYYANPFEDEREAKVIILDHQAMFAMEYQGKFEDENGPPDTDWGDFNAYRWAIAQLESGQNYKAVSPVNKGGQRAYGKYQMLGSNIRNWAGMSPEEFMNNPDAQERVFAEQAKICYNQYHNWDDCASMWFSGRPAKNNNASDVTGTTVPRYIQITRGNMRIYMQKHGDQSPQSLPVLPTGARIPESQTYMFPGLGTMANDALAEHCHLFGCDGPFVNNPGATYPRVLPNGNRVVFKAELHDNCKDGRPHGCPHTGMSSFVP